MKKDILDKLNIGENHMIECKLAEGGLPIDLWETYSSFANTEGGTVFLGIKEHRESFEIKGLSEKQILKYQKDFWSTANDRQKVSKNILLNHHVIPIELDGKKILRIDIPAADRHDKPVYIGVDPMKGTYRRDFEGDFLCQPDEVRAMFADQRDESADSKAVENMDIDAFNMDTLKSYRILFENLHTNHPWNRLRNDEFLLKLTALKKLDDGRLVPTIAGLLMFGNADSIVQVLPGYFLDYREESNEKGVRWLFRVTSDEGDWSGNLYDFYHKVINRADDDVAVPFVNRKDGVRVDETAVHDAIKEAIANALVHANYYGRQGIVIVKKHKELTISNPGSLRITREEFFAGGNSDPRNPLVLKMFSRINVGERAGSGIDKIMTAWKEQGWKIPEFSMTLRPERITVRLEVGQIIYLPGVFDLRKNKNGSSDEEEIKSKTQAEIIIAYIEQNGSIKMSEAMEVLGYQSRSGARKVIDKLVDLGILIRTGDGPATKYTLNLNR